MNNVVSFSQSELKEYSVTEISGQIKTIIERQFGYVRIRGEISGLKIAASGHGYFNLKDENAVIAATCWRHVLSKMPAKPDEGLEVIATGRVTTYAGQSKYQLSVEHIEPAGAGALMQILAARKAKLQSEGLFDLSRKKPIPFFPRTIGIITSITGAVIKDMIHRISDRCPVKLLIWPVSVQGETAADEVSKAMYGFNNMEPLAKPDVIIVARGGGSIEDLWAFNEEIVVRAVAASTIPVISAIGHETDFTLTDFAADMRAPTPTAAAEFATPVIADIKHTLSSYFDRIHKNVTARIRYLRDLISAHSTIIAKPYNIITRSQQNLDNLIFSFYELPKKFLNLKKIQLSQYRIEFLNPAKMLPFKYNHLQMVSDNLNKKAKDILDNFVHRLTMCSSLLSSLDYKNVISRGFSVIRSTSGKIISSTTTTNIGENLTAEMKDGELSLTVTSSVKR
ncbi:MAG: exodeoxyribonuclease VII large subunit [Rickettsiaceae bacterium]|nr:exodeoxyribonuclease VII large subunit [Rickettsiaceae bacterium]